MSDDRNDDGRRHGVGRGWSLQQTTTTTTTFGVDPPFYNHTTTATTTSSVIATTASTPVRPTVWSIPTHTARDDDNNNDNHSNHADTTLSAATTNTNNNTSTDDDTLELNLLVIDHYDSFTYNLVDLLGQVCTRPPTVLAADCATHWTDVPQLLPNNNNDWDGIVVSPGPGHAHDTMCHLAHSAMIHNPQLPILGVCLGHQIMGVVYGAACVPAPQPRHGQVHPVEFPMSSTSWNETDATTRHPTTHCVAPSLFPPLPGSWNETCFVPPPSYNVTRYHSLQVVWPTSHGGGSSAGLPIVPTAFAAADDNESNHHHHHTTTNTPVVMALQHVQYPHYGVQFHPESIGSQPQGKALLERFCHICHDYKQQRQQQQQQQDETRIQQRKSQQVSSSRRVQAHPPPTLSQTPTTTTNNNLTTNNNNLQEAQNRTVPSPRYQVYVHKVVSLGSNHCLRPQHVMNDIIMVDNDSHANHKDKDDDDDKRDASYCFWLDEASYTDNDDHTHTNHSPNHPTDDPVDVTQHEPHASKTTTISILGHFGPRQRRVEYWGVEKPKQLRGIHEWWWKPHKDDNNDEQPENCTHSPALDPSVQQQQQQQQQQQPPPPPNDGDPNHKEQTATMGCVAYRHDPDQDIVQYLQSQHCHPTQEVHWVEAVAMEDPESEPVHDTRETENDSPPLQEGRWSWNVQPLSQSQVQTKLPFAYRGGHVGYLGYEVRHITEQLWASQEHGSIPTMHDDIGNTTLGYIDPDTLTADQTKPPITPDRQIPTAAFGFADQSFVYHHETQEWYLVGVVVSHPGTEDEEHDSTRGEGEMIQWMQETSARMQHWVESRSDRQDHSPTNLVNDSGTPMRETLTHDKEPNDDEILTFVPKRSRERYYDNFEMCLKHIYDGESYELCLTNQLEGTVKVDSSTVTSRPAQTESQTTSSALDLYHVLRQQNPAPFSAFLDWNSNADNDNGSPSTGSALSICCSSPERFISVVPMVRSDNMDAGDQWSKQEFQVEAKPIKGTVARIVAPDNASALAQERFAKLDHERAKALHCSEKDRAENLMIVDLLRNDLSRVCQVGSVHVAKLMDIETYATVHQMVSTIRGTFALDVDDKNEREESDSTVDVLTACFPGGSMTGAPKVRTMALLHDLEEGAPRGPYSGALGYISVNGAIDMNKVIRTAVLTPAWDEDGKSHSSCPSREGVIEHKEENRRCDCDQYGWNVNVGAGGAITVLSDKQDEYDEMMLKARAVTRAVQIWAQRLRNK